MKLKEYLNELNTLATKYPEILDFEVVYAHDDEGNEYQKIYSSPTICEVMDDDADDKYVLLLAYFKGQGGDTELKDCNAIMLN